MEGAMEQVFGDSPTNQHVVDEVASHNKAKPRPLAKTRKSARATLACISAGARTPKEVAVASGIPEGTASRRMGELLREGYIRSIGRRRHGEGRPHELYEAVP
jgi:predicted ArsR family transcriptional regulator